MNLSPWFFLEICEFIVSGGSSAGPPGRYNPPGRARRGGRALVGCAHLGAPLVQVLAPEILIIDIKNPRKVSFHSENFYFCTKNDITVVLLKTMPVRFSSNKIIPKPYKIFANMA